MSSANSKKQQIKKSVKRLGKKAWDKANDIQTVQGEVLKNAPYVAGNASFAINLAFLSSYGFARIKGQVRVKQSLVKQREDLAHELLQTLHQKPD